MRRALFLAPILAAALAAPVHASTIPDAGLRRGQVAVALGLADASVDWSPLERLQVGAGGYFTLTGTGGYGRLTYQLLQGSPIGDVGFHLAGGKYNAVLVKTAAHEGLFAFAGPVLAKSFGGVTLRASLGLIATDGHNLVYDTSQPGMPSIFQPIVARSWGLGIDDSGTGFPGLGPFVPNLEVAFRLHPDHELTLGGNAIIGWRGRFGSK